ncbi:Peptidase family M23 [Candidatus Bilamarchaeum dharawalense]|uniref:Peptidase family M23 n=1 Tax=Candidatus Bilamarchaeum dharawalense TaxID=2885759 RepID=A0A5E4LRP1_9ARCH|nr:Peptidase family M23 [Candidatus Bilamarchaeum dharawalense]
MATPEQEVPRKVDPFEVAFEKLNASLRQGGKIHFNASRGSEKHAGIDLIVPNNTPIQLPVEKAVLIGTARGNESMGNALVFFVPDEKQPYFLFFLHLSAKTFTELKKQGISIGSEVSSSELDGKPIAYSGNTGRSTSPHLHVSATVKLQSGQTAEEFMQMYREGSLPSFLQGKNFYPLQLLGSGGLIKKGYIDPTDLILDRRLAICSLPNLQPPPKKPRFDGDTAVALVR